MDSSLSDEISKLISQKGLCESLKESYNAQNLSVFQLKKAKMQAKSRIERKLKEYTFFERLQKTFLYDEDFFISLMQKCSSVERPFIIIYLNRLNLFGNSVDLEYLLAKKMRENTASSEKHCVIIGGVRYSQCLIEDVLRSSAGLLDVDLKPNLYWISEEERIESAVTFMKIIEESSFTHSKFFLNQKQFINRAKDVCCALSFIRTVQSMLEPAVYGAEQFEYE